MGDAEPDRQASQVTRPSTLVSRTTSVIQEPLLFSLPVAEEMAFPSIRSLVLFGLAATGVQLVSALSTPKCGSIPKCTSLNQRKAWYVGILSKEKVRD